MRHARSCDRDRRIFPNGVDTHGSSSARQYREPDFAPERGPVPLSTKPSERVNQMLGVAENPSDQQVLTVARKLLEGTPNPDPVRDIATAKVSAQATFDNFRTLAAEKEEAEKAVREARAQALSVSQSLLQLSIKTPTK